MRTLLEDIVERQLFADVPVGTPLSGGSPTASSRRRLLPHREKSRVSSHDG
nr:asparagine synthase-related protein [Streptomyces poonensis]